VGSNEGKVVGRVVGAGVTVLPGRYVGSSVGDTVGALDGDAVGTGVDFPAKYVGS